MILSPKFSVPLHADFSTKPLLADIPDTTEHPTLEIG
jgi:hypothetical protein